MALLHLVITAAIIGFIYGYYVSIIVYRNNHTAIAAILLFITCVVIAAPQEWHYILYIKEKEIIYVILVNTGRSWRY